MHVLLANGAGDSQPQQPVPALKLAQVPQLTTTLDNLRPASPATARATPSKVRVVLTHSVDRMA